MLLGEEQQQLARLRRLEATDLPAAWVDEHSQGWDDADFRELMAFLESEIGTLDPHRVWALLNALLRAASPELFPASGRVAPAYQQLLKRDKLATAEWGDSDDLAVRRAFAPGDLWLYRSPVSNAPIGFDDDRHVGVFCTTRSGKGTSFIVPQHCLWLGSLVSIDPSGENATITAARRGRGNGHCVGMGQDVHVLDPFGVADVDDAYRSSFNPLDALDPGEPKFLEKAGSVADAIVVISKQSSDPVWAQKARTPARSLSWSCIFDVATMIAVA